MVGTGRGAERGILFRGGEALETAHRIDTVVLDKTGTLTEGGPSVTDVDRRTPPSTIDDAAAARGASAERGSEHPLGRRDRARGASAAASTRAAPTRFEAVAGRASSPTSTGRARARRQRASCSLRRRGVDTRAAQQRRAPSRQAAGRKTPIRVAIDGVPAGVVAVADTSCASAAEAVRRLRRHGRRGRDAHRRQGGDRREAIAERRSASTGVVARGAPGGQGAQRARAAGGGPASSRWSATASTTRRRSPGRRRHRDRHRHGRGDGGGADVTLMRRRPARRRGGDQLLSRATMRTIRQNLVLGVRLQHRAHPGRGRRRSTSCSRACSTAGGAEGAAADLRPRAASSTRSSRRGDGDEQRLGDDEQPAAAYR